jgi:hypothetical protein
MFNAIQRNPFTIGLVCLLLLLLLWLPALLFPIAPQTLDAAPMMPLQEGMIKGLHLYGQTGIWASLIFMTLTVGTLFVINRNHLFVAGQEQLLLLIFILLSAALPASQQFSGAQVASLCVLLSMNYLFNAIQKMKALSAVFLSACCASLASLFYFPAAITLFVLFVGILMAKPFAWRDWMAFLAGIATPYFYLFLYYYLESGDYTALGEIIILNIPQIALFTPDFSIVEYLFFVLLTIVILWSLLPFRTSGSLIKIKTTRMRQMLKFLLLLFAVTGLLFKPAHAGMMPLIAFPISVLVADYYDHIRRKKLFNTLLLLLCITVICLRII